MSKLVQLVEELRERLSTIADGEQKLVASLREALNRFDQKLLQDVRTITAEHESRRSAILNELWAGAQIEHDVFRRQVIDLLRQRAPERSVGVGEIVDEMSRRGDETELGVLVLRVVSLVELRHTKCKRHRLPLEMIEVALHRHAKSGANRRGAAVQIDEDGRGAPRQRQGEVDREGGLADAALARHHWYDPARHVVNKPNPKR